MFSFMDSSPRLRPMTVRMAKLSRSACILLGYAGMGEISKSIHVGFIIVVVTMYFVRSGLIPMR